jgi:hypothetical protein
MDRSGDHVKWNKTDSERQIPDVFSCTETQSNVKEGHTHKLWTTWWEAQVEGGNRTACGGRI